MNNTGKNSTIQYFLEHTSQTELDISMLGKTVLNSTILDRTVQEGTELDKLDQET